MNEQQAEIVAESKIQRDETLSLVSAAPNLAENYAFTYNAQTISSHVTGEKTGPAPDKMDIHREA